MYRDDQEQERRAGATQYQRPGFPVTCSLQRTWQLSPQKKPVISTATMDSCGFHWFLTHRVLHLQIPAARVPSHSLPRTRAREWDPHRQLAPASAAVLVHTHPLWVPGVSFSKQAPQPDFHYLFCYREHVCGKPCSCWNASQWSRLSMLSVSPDLALSPLTGLHYCASIYGETPQPRRTHRWSGLLQLLVCLHSPGPCPQHDVHV